VYPLILDSVYLLGTSSVDSSALQWNLFIMVTLGPTGSGCHKEVICYTILKPSPLVVIERRPAHTVTIRFRCTAEACECCGSIIRRDMPTGVFYM